MVGRNYMLLYAQYMATYSKTLFMNPSIASQCISGNGLYSHESRSPPSAGFSAFSTHAHWVTTQDQTLNKHSHTRACSHTAFCQVMAKENDLATIHNFSVLERLIVKQFVPCVLSKMIGNYLKHKRSETSDSVVLCNLWKGCMRY